MASFPLRRTGLVIVSVLVASNPVVAQNEDAVYFQKTLAKAQAGDAEAMEAVAGMYLSGTGAPKPDVPTGLNWERKAAQAGNADAQLSLGDIYFKAQGPGYPAANHAESFKWYELAAKQGNTRALLKVADFYELGDGVKKDPAQALKFVRQAAEANGDRDAALRLGQMYAEGRGTTKNVVEANRWLATAKRLMAEGADQAFADFKDANPDRLDKVIAAASPVVQQNFAKSGNDDANARYELGKAFYNGTDGIPADQDQGLQWLKYAAESGGDSVRKKTADFLASVGRDTQAFPWYLKLAEYGDADAEFAVARDYETGTGTDKNLDEAFRWYRHSAQGGNVRGMMALAQHLIDLKDSEAKIWLERAAAKGDTQASGLLAQLTKGREQSPIVAPPAGDPVPVQVQVKVQAQAAALPDSLAQARLQFELGFDHAANDFERMMLTKWFSEDVATAMATSGLSKRDGTEYLLKALLPRLEKNLDASYPCIDQLNQSTFDLALLRERASPSLLAAVTREANAVTKNFDASIAFLNSKKALFDRAQAGDAQAEYEVGALYASNELLHDQSLALSWLKKAAAHGQTSAAKILQSMSAPAFNAGADAAKAGQMPLALAKFRLAAELGEPEANYWIGYIHSIGYEGVAPNLTEAVKYYRVAADAGIALSMIELGKAYTWGKGQAGVPADPVEGGRWFRKAADTGHPAAQMMLAQCYLWGEAGCTKSEEEAKKWFHDAAAKGEYVAALWNILLENCPTDADRQVMALGYAELAVHESANLDDAVYWLEKAERFGFAPARAWLIAQEKIGHTPPGAELREEGSKAYEAKKMSEAIASWQKAAAAGNPDAMIDLGTTYFYGEGVPQDRKAGEAWYGKAAALGYFPAQFKLREAQSWDLLQAALALHQAGKKDEARAKFIEASTLGSETALYNLGVLYENGDGVPQDLRQALKLYQRASALMQQEAVGAATRVTSRLIEREKVEFGISSLRANRFALAQMAFEAASAAGNVEATVQLGLTYETRTDGLANYENALRCYDVAAQMEYPTAKGLADKLLAKIAAGGTAPKADGAASTK